MEPGDALLLFTDGMLEATDPKGREFGVERLKRAFVAIRERPADEIVRALIDKVGEHTRGPAEDDRTVVVVKRVSSDQATVPVPTVPAPVRPTG
jgi:sigma-B regulation protein RsbU (phosphoserine phosphatase)